MNLNTFKNLYISELQDLYSAETQLLTAIPRLIVAASNMDLKRALEEHLNQTYEHVNRLDQIFAELMVQKNTELCDAMKGILTEGEKIIRKFGDDDVKDAALIASAQRVEHYEIAAYGSTRTFAKHLGYDQHVKLLQKTLDEEGNADKTLTKIAEGNWFSQGLNQEALSKTS
ncbi:MAG: ferritin-like domain-containing protein [Verrucomicrobiota bacterium]